VEFIDRISIVHRAAFLLTLTALLSTPLQAQKSTSPDSTVRQEKDLMDVLQQLFNSPEDTSASSISEPSISLLPIIGYNPSFGGVLGVNMVMGKQNGDPANTGYSVYTFGVTYGTKGILTIQSRHNVFKPENKWNFQGNWQFSKFGLIDHGLGTGNTAFCSSEFIVGDYPTTLADSAFPLKYNYVRLLEKAYRKLGAHTYAGLGLSFDMYNKIQDARLTDTTNTPHQRYSLEHNFNPEKYSANGLILAFQFNNREHPIRSYGGIYLDVNLRFDQKWMGSTRNSIQINYDFRKYWSLSKRNPEHVIAIWHWASYLVSGEVPYLELPYTGSDTYNRSGRAYTIGYFRGLSYAYFETEYRYPITRNNLISGVVFVNCQTAANDDFKKVYDGYNLGGGAGLRILFQKKSRSAVCVDFSKGQCGSSGIFFGLNEVF
jgi:Omp85 superfamily domain